MEKPVIAIDGTAASGKGTLARKLAEKLAYAYLDTGLLYRRTGLLTLAAAREKNLPETDAALAASCAQALERDHSLLRLDDPGLRSADAGRMASVTGAVPAVRRALVDLQRGFAFNPPGGAKGAVLDGRDIGTVICPAAPVKFFVDADPLVRAQRRHSELQARGENINLETVIEDMRVRDARDGGRADAPMKAAADALVIDTSARGPDEVFALAWDHIVKSGKIPAG